MTVKATCYTNLDDYRRTEWPTEFIVLPCVGDYVEGHGSDVRGMTHPVLRVVNVTHGFRRHATLNGEPEPCIRLELHK